MKTTLRCLFIFILMAVFLPACQGTAAPIPTAMPLQKISICYSSLSATQSVAWYAVEKGIFKKYGLDVNMVSVSSGTQAVSALIAGQMTACEVGSAAVVSSIAEGSDVVVIGGLFNDILYSLIASSSIKTAADLKSKVVAITKLGSDQDRSIHMALTHLGLQPDQDVTIMAVGDDSARQAAMDSGQISASLVTIPISPKLTAKGYHELLDMQSLNLPYMRTVIAARRSGLKNDRPALKNFMKAIVESIGLMKKDRPGSETAIAKYLGLDATADKGYLDAIYDTLIVKYLPASPYPSLAGAQNVLDDAKTANPKAANLKTQDILDLSLLDELKSSGFISN
jgi:NitT/TauT family transport system substrate-binding protein